MLDICWPVFPSVALRIISRLILMASFKVIKTARCILISNQIEWNLTSERNLSRAFRNYENRNVVMMITGETLLVRRYQRKSTSGSYG